MPITTSTDTTLTIDGATATATITGEPLDLFDAFLIAVNGRGEWTAPLWGELAATAWERRWEDTDEEDDLRSFWNIAKAAAHLAADAGAPAYPIIKPERIEYVTVTGTVIALERGRVTIAGEPGAVLRRLRAAHAEPGGLDGAKLRQAAAADALSLAAEQVRAWQTPASSNIKMFDVDLGPAEAGAVVDEEAS